MRGIVFDIQRFALHDGPGIRTTVFLKGCALRCIWCHNPESQSFAPQREVASADCEEVRWVGKEHSAGEILGMVVRDKAFFETSGGGMTLSGGEPLAQPAFVLALLKGARSLGIHTCIDTSGYVAARHLAAAAAFTDLFLFDCKATDPQRHRDLTGESNDLILSNLELLDRLHAEVILRCPLVPGVNDDDEHLASIASLSRRFDCIRAVEILPYHSMGREKATRVGMPITLPDHPDATLEDQSRWSERLRHYGASKLRATPVAG